MKNIYEISEDLRKLIVQLDDFQKEIRKIPTTEDRKENLLKEMISINLSAAENSLLSINSLLINADSIDEITLQFAVDQSKKMLENFTKEI